MERTAAACFSISYFYFPLVVYGYARAGREVVALFREGHALLCEMGYRPCITCGRLMRRGSYCRRCNPRSSGWQQERFRRDTFRARGEACSRCGSTSDVQAHHPVPVSEGGGCASVGVPLRERCHRREHGG